jgi:hypothetical protein
MTADPGNICKSDYITNYVVNYLPELVTTTTRIASSLVTVLRSRLPLLSISPIRYKHNDNPRLGRVRY